MGKKTLSEWSAEAMHCWCCLRMPNLPELHKLSASFRSDERVGEALFAVVAGDCASSSHGADWRWQLESFFKSSQS